MQTRTEGRIGTLFQEYQWTLGRNQKFIRFRTYISKHTHNYFPDSFIYARLTTETFE